MTTPSSDWSSMWQRSTTRQFLKWLFSWRTARRALISIAVILTLVGLFYAEENLRGKRAWDKYRQELEARGEQLEWKAFIPKPVPDNQNFAVTPLIQSWFERSKPHYESWSDRTNKPARDNFSQAGINVNEQLKGDPANRHFLDLVAWGTAFDAIRAGTFSKRQKIKAGKLDFESRAKTAPSVLEGLKTNEAMFAELRAATQRPYCRYPINYNVEDPVEILLPHLNRIRDGVCRRLLLKACAELADGQSDEALNDVNLILYMADSLKEEPFVISYLVRIGCLGIAIQPIWEGLAEHAWSDAQLQELQGRLRQYNLVADMRMPLAAERAAGIAVIDFARRNLIQLFDVVGSVSPTPTDQELSNCLGKIVPRGWWYQEQLNYCRFFQMQLDGAFDSTKHRVSHSRIASNKRVLDRGIRGGGVGGAVTAFLHHRIMATMLAWALDEFPRKGAAAQTAVDQAMLACALERYRLANGQFPEKLDGLVPAFISPLPQDVITGEPYKYRRTDDGQFILYSVGWDEKDDGGVPGNTEWDYKQGDWVWQYPPAR